MVVEAASSKHTLKEPLLNEVKKKKKKDTIRQEKKTVRLAKISFSLD